MSTSWKWGAATAALVIVAGVGRFAGAQEATPQAPRPLPSAEEIKKLPADGGPDFNRLIFESSPYLLQHARNPVKWFPWGPEAWAKAKAESKPVFLSVGYSTCHWCHVMEKECFENPAVAKLLNDSFVSVKVDREERPDVDNVYMAALQEMSGSGGWPMSVFLTPDKKPFFAGTYFPADDHFGRPGFKTILGKIAQAWKEERDKLVATAEQLAKAIQPAVRSGTAELSEDTLKKAASLFSIAFDKNDGGFGHAPKFPRTSVLDFLLRESQRTGDTSRRSMVEATLEHMARGGIRDQLGGGFHRYSTDAEWHVPHFEKMLYDQARIATAYVEACQATHDDSLSAVARDTFRYVLRDLTDAGGGFQSAEDADSEGVEGKFYLWTRAELATVLGDADAALFARVYSVGDEPSILRLSQSLAALAPELKSDVASLDSRLTPMREKLFAVRERRVHPRKDDKVLADWNGLMISALATGGRALDDPGYTRAASRAAAFVLGKMQADGRLLHRYRAGSAAIKGHLDDYAFFVQGLVDLYEATLEVRWLREAKRLAGDLQRLFWDKDAHGFRLSAADDEALLTNSKELYDGALPSGNSVATATLFRLGRILGDRDLETRAGENLQFFSQQIEANPDEFPQMLCALELAVGPSREIVLAGKIDDPALLTLRRTVDDRFLPGSVTIFHPLGADSQEAETLSPQIKDQLPLDGKPAAYVCTHNTCALPVTTPSELNDLLSKVKIDNDK